MNNQLRQSFRTGPNSRPYIYDGDLSVTAKSFSNTLSSITTSVEIFYIRQF